MPFRTDKPIDIIWSPHKDDEFVAYGRDLYLFKVNNSSTMTIEETEVKLCNETNAEVVANYNENLNPKLVAWYLGEDSPNLYAIVLPNSKIQLISYVPNNSKRTSPVGSKFFEVQKEFSLKQIRHCTNLAWNSWQKNILAAGFEKIRNEHAILVWDVRGGGGGGGGEKTRAMTGGGGGGGQTTNSSTESIIYCLDYTQSEPMTSGLLSSTSRAATAASLFNMPSSLVTGVGVSSPFHTSSSSTSVETSASTRAAKPCNIRSVYETGTSETCNSLAWDPHSPYSLLTGVNGKTLKIFDIRVNTKATHSVNTKYVLGFSINPSPNDNQHQAASYFENVVCIWDIRMFEKPIYQIVEQDMIVKMQWCPSKSEKLGILVRNSNSINVYSIKTLVNSVKSNAAAVEDERAQVQVSVEKISRKNSNPSIRKDQQQQQQQGKEMIMSKSMNLTPSSLTSSYITNFTWYTFDSNKILVAENALLQNLYNLTLSDTFAITWTPNGDLCWSSSFGRINMLENVDSYELELVNQLKRRTKSDYGLKYEIITINNGSATLTLSSSSSTVGGGVAASNTTPASSSSTTPLALALYSHNGLQTIIRCDFYYNAKICEVLDDQQANMNTKFLWQWFHRLNFIFEKTIPLNPRNNLFELSMNCRNALTDLYPVRYCGLKILLSELIERKFDSTEMRVAFEERFKLLAYNLCDWIIKDGVISSQFFTNLESNNEFERACCLALLTKNHDQALEILDSASKNDNRYGCLWIALKYFCEEQQQQQQQQPNKSISSTVFKSPSSPLNQSLAGGSTIQLSSPSRQQSLNASFEATGNVSTTPTSKSASSSQQPFSESLLKDCNELTENFNSPYLRALFNYLINREEALTKILYDKDLKFKDRIALSIYFMFEHSKYIQLAAYFDKLIDEECLECADMNGVLLTGLSPRCIDLFQAFIDRTGDIQTVSLALIHTPYLDVLQCKQAVYWINSYREQLNKLKFWEKRAEFDILKMKLGKSQSLVSSPQFHHQHQQLSPSQETSGGSFGGGGGGDAANLSSSSSSSITSGSTNNPLNVPVVTPTHRPSMPNTLHQQHQSHHQLTRMGSNQTLRQFQRNYSMSSQMVAVKTDAQSSAGGQKLSAGNSSPSPLVNLLCNKCGKNLTTVSGSGSDRLNVSSSSHQLTTATATFNLSSSLTSSSAIATANTSASGKDGNIITTEPSIIGCLNCANFLPQCTVCLRIMKINLYPLPPQNQTSNQQFLPKSQSIYFQSPKIHVPGGGFGAAKKTSSVQHFKSSNSQTCDESQQSDQQQQQQINDKSDEQTLNRRILELSSESLSLIANTKIGNWFSWCQTCKHGGHIKHLIEWFRTNQTCPYLHCKCQCLSIDFVY